MNLHSIYKYVLLILVLFASILQAFKLVSDAEYEEAKHWIVYDTVGRYLSTPQLKATNEMDWLPNSNKIGFGYNPIRGDPICYTGDCHMNGYGRALFRLTYTNPAEGSCTTKMIPQNVELECIPSTEVREKTQRIVDIKDLKESTASGSSFAFGFELPLTSSVVDLNKLAFSYGQSEQSTKMLNHLYQDKSILYHTYARISTMKLSLFAPKLELSDNFRYVIENLPATGQYSRAVEKYIQDYVINYFGFTFTSEILLGGIAQMLTVINSTATRPSELTSSSDTEMIGLSFAKAFSFNYNQQESENTSKLEDFQRYVKSSVATTLGGETYAEKQKLTEWFQTVPDNPVVIKFTLQSIFDLITSARFPNDTKLSEKIGYISQALTEYLNKTTTFTCKNQCTNDKQGVCKLWDLYAYGNCSCLNGYSGDDCSIPPTPPSTVPPTTPPAPVPTAPIPASSPVPPVLPTTTPVVLIASTTIPLSPEMG